MINQKGLEAAEKAGWEAIEHIEYDTPNCYHTCAAAIQAAITAYLPHHESELVEALKRIALLDYNNHCDLFDAVKIAKQALSNYNKGE